MRTRTKGIQLDGNGERIIDKQYCGERLFERLGKVSQDEAEAWLDPGVMVYRWNVAIALVLGKLEGVKVGNEFTEEVFQATQETRTKKILEHVLPAVSDSATKKLLLDTGDIREMVALALGSAAYQQQ